MSRTSHRIARTVAALAAVLFAAACSDLVDMVRLSRALTKDFGQATVQLTGHTHLSVTFQNSPVAGRADEAQTAQRVAEYVRDHYPKYRRLQDVNVVFETNRQYGPADVTRSGGNYTFTRTELGDPAS